MTTHRSLNKLEYRAHMNIHEIKEVGENETHEADYTRDRFGKKHFLADKHGNRRIQAFRKILTVLVLVQCFFFFFGVLADTDPAPVQKLHLNVPVESEDFGSIFNKPVKRKRKFEIPLNESTALGINSDGDPTVNRSF